MKLPYSKPKLVKYDDLAKTWYVYFRYNDKVFKYTGKMGYEPNKAKRVLMGKALEHVLLKKLESGWIPLIKEPINKESNEYSLSIFQTQLYNKISEINKTFDCFKEITTNSKFKLLQHYRSILKMLNNYKFSCSKISGKLTIEDEKVLLRILFSPIVDNFEIYLASILNEIYLAEPSTLKSEQLVKFKDVLNCCDMQSIITTLANQTISKLQKGSIKGFISDNKQIKALDVINKTDQEEIEKILQIRHLYTHRNGIVDEKFLKYFPSGYYGSEYEMSINELLNKMIYLVKIVNTLDRAAISKYNLLIFKN